MRQKLCLSLSVRRNFATQFWISNRLFSILLVFYKVEEDPSLHSRRKLPVFDLFSVDYLCAMEEYSCPLDQSDGRTGLCSRLINAALESAPGLLGDGSKELMLLNGGGGMEDPPDIRVGGRLTTGSSGGNLGHLLID